MFARSNRREPDPSSGGKLRLEVSRLRVIRIRRPRYGCRACGTIHQAPAPERPIARGLATPGLLAHVLVSKYCDHLPLYRQSQIFARNGVDRHTRPGQLSPGMNSKRGPQPSDYERLEPLSTDLSTK